MLAKIQSLPWQKAFSFAKKHKNPLLGCLAGLLVILLYTGSRNAQPQITVYETKQKEPFKKIIPDTSDFYRKRDSIYRNQFAAIERQIKDLSEKLETEQEEEEHSSPEVESPTSLEPPPRDFFTGQPQPYPNITAPDSGPNIISFPLDYESPKEPAPTLPSGSFVKAKILTGIEAPEGKTFPVLLQADYGFIGPNNSFVNLAGCFLIAKSTGNLSIERVEMQATKISCVSPSGEFFEQEIKGFVADNSDNSFAVIGEVNSKQERVAGMAFLASIVEGIGNAISKAQTSVSTNSSGGQTMEITGDQGRYLAAGGASSAASTVTNWYLKHAENLLPTINVGSGRDIWIVLQDSTTLPDWFFKKANIQSGEKHYLKPYLR